jgi:hypothetical protein
MMLKCPCGAMARERKKFATQLAQGTRSVEPTTWEEHREERENG